jgi:hypothetical protein
MTKAYEKIRAGLQEVLDALRSGAQPRETKIPGVYELSEESRIIIEKQQIKRGL